MTEMRLHVRSDRGNPGWFWIKKQFLGAYMVHIQINQKLLTEALNDKADLLETIILKTINDFCPEFEKIHIGLNFETFDNINDVLGIGQVNHKGTYTVNYFEEDGCA